MKRDIGDLVITRVQRSGIRRGLHTFFAPELIPYLGEEVYVARLTELQVSIWTLKGKFICTACEHFFFDRNFQNAKLTVERKGVRINDKYYWNDELFEFLGMKILVSMENEKVTAYTLGNKFIGVLSPGEWLAACKQSDVRKSDSLQES